MTNYLPSILIAGGHGQLGKALSAHSAHAEFRTHITTRAEMDITQMTSIHHAIAHYKPDIIINAAAYTAVDKAEQENEAAMQANYLGPQNLAIACKKNQIPLIHISTDYIFDGLETSPYHEEHAANPINVYGKSKWLGEQAVREQCEQHFILRISGVFSEYGQNFLKTILRLAAERNELSIVADQMTCPTYAGHIAGVIYSMAKQLSTFGTYHYCDIAPTSWHAFAQAIMAEAALHTTRPLATLKAISIHEYPTAAKRPLYSVLDCHKIAEHYRITQADWHAAIKHIVPLLLNAKG